jgi:nucleotide-binding universal stress UspA family protein
MTTRPAILCPVDFSDASRNAARHAAAVAERFAGDVVALAVMDPLLAEAAEIASITDQLPAAVRTQLISFYDEACGPGRRTASVRYEVAVGKPATEILRCAADHGIKLIVMGTHGLTGLRKLFFGSTTERVLRETTVPVLLTPAAASGSPQIDDLPRAIRRVLVPVDLTPATAGLAAAAGRIAQALDLPLIIGTVIEPVRLPLAGIHLPNLDAERRFRADTVLAELVASMPAGVRAESLVVYGDPAEEIQKLARDRQAGLIVMGLHASTMLGPRMGSVTYRVMCTTSALGLALPPETLTASPAA